ncbi:hypothetical protein D9756_004442 [Leucocoprinus leucothites]|uniref:Nephrocystin 3-like N-terminal domain-containing protein n=1 Tax=Leucocoprinus leucothites TaxID=201217 RepID=A0A8H5LKV0_9AGAR|nr:hypothetical protein D9756_004442 [Leucoagaricus leucothites]
MSTEAHSTTISVLEPLSFSMEFFRDAKDFVVTNPVFVEHPQSGRGKKLLYNASRMEAAHDSAANEFAAEILPKTRHGSILEDLSTWAECSNRLGDYLAASFFFSREKGVEDPTQFFPTISHQLATHFPAYEALIDAKLHQNPELLSQSLTTQFHELIARPFQQLQAGGETTVGSRQIIIVNGLDKCKGDQALQELLGILTTETDSLPFEWLVFTRPDIPLDGQRLEAKSTALPNLDAWHLKLRNCCAGPGDTRVCAVRLEGDGIWIILFGSMHKAAHWAYGHKVAFTALRVFKFSSSFLIF